MVDQIFTQAVKIDEENKGIEKDASKCIDCGECQRTCEKITGLNFKEKVQYCLSCGQCILTCPTNALKPKNAKDRVLQAMNEGKTVICYTSPAVRVSVGEAFGMDAGTFCMGKLVKALYQLGFTYVLDTTFGADLTIMEEASELKERFDHDGVLPMMSSCCPAWVKYVKDWEPGLIDHLSTCKSPIGMEGQMIYDFFAPLHHLKKEDLFTVAITPCTAKKMENMSGTDAVLTISEVIQWIHEKNIPFRQLEDQEFSSFFQEGSGGGTLFGSTGGVSTSVLRTFYYLETGKDLEMEEAPTLTSFDSVKVFQVPIKERMLQVAVVHTLKEVRPLIEMIKRQECPYDFIEVMNCPGGCIGGGGEPKNHVDEKVYEKRIDGLVKRDEERVIRMAHHNPDIRKIYDEFLKIPNGVIAHKYLHIDHQKN